MSATSAVSNPATQTPSHLEGSKGTRTTSPLLSSTAVVLVLGLALVKGLSPYLEPDVWWHLHVGGRILSTHQLIFWDPTAAFAARPYVATQWLPEVVTSAAYSVGGPGVVLWLRAAAVVALVAVVYVACRRYAARLPAAVVAGLTMMGAGGGLNPRPQLVSFVLFAVTVHACCGMASDRRPRWLLVPVFWLWACSHGLWAFGLALSALVLLALAADPLTRPSRPQLIRLGLLWGACLMAVLTTPLGPRLLLTPFAVAGNASMIADEWRATPLNNVFSWSALLALISCAVLWSLRPTRRPWWRLALLAFALACTLWMWRLVPLGAIAAAPLLAGALQEHRAAAREPFGRGERRGLLVGSTLLLAVAAAVSATPWGTSAQAFPGRMGAIDDALRSLPAHAVVFDDFGVSGWLLHEHPRLTPVADLRGEIYARDHLSRYRDALAAKPGWREFVRQTGADWALLRADSPLSDALQHRKNWHEVASDAGFVLLHQEDS